MMSLESNMEVIHGLIICVILREMEIKKIKFDMIQLRKHK